MTQDTFDLGEAAAAIDAGHHCGQGAGIGDPARSAAFAEAAKIGEFEPQGHRSGRSSRTWPPGPGRQGPRSADGSSWHRGRRSDGPVRRPQQRGRAPGPRAGRHRRACPGSDTVAGYPSPDRPWRCGVFLSFSFMPRLSFPALYRSPCVSRPPGHAPCASGPELRAGNRSSSGDKCRARTIPIRMRHVAQGSRAPA